MIKDTMYKELRDELEIYERSRKNGREQKEPILCSYIRKKKEEDIRLVIRMHQLELQKAVKQRASLKSKKVLAAYRADLLAFLEDHNAKEKTEICTVKEADAVAEKIFSLYCDRKKKDAYIALQEVYLDYKLGRASAQELLETVHKLLKANRKYNIGKDYKEALKNEDLSDADIETIAEELATAILVAEAKGFLYDAGYPLEPGAKKKKARRQDHILELVDMFLENNAAVNCSKEVSLSAEECYAIYEKLQKAGRDDIFLPLYMDPVSGAGLYILGTKYVEKEALREAQEEGYRADFCHFCCLFWQDIFEDNGILVAMKTEAYGDDYDAAWKAFCDGRADTEAFTYINQDCLPGMNGKVNMYFSKPDREFVPQDYLSDRNKAISNQAKSFHIGVSRQT